MSKPNKRGEISDEAFAVKMAERNQTIEGLEIPDPTPMAPPLGFIRQPSMVDRIRDMVRAEHLRQDLERAGAESFEEADDFDVEDDLHPMSGYENDPQFEPAAPSSDPTGVPPPAGGGKGGGVVTEPEAPKEPAKEPAPVAAPKAS